MRQPFQALICFFRKALLHGIKRIHRFNALYHGNLLLRKPYADQLFIRIGSENRFPFNLFLHGHFLYFKYLNPACNLIDGALFALCPCIGFVMMVHPEQHIHVRIRASDYDRPVCIVNAHRADIPVNAFLNFFIMNPDRIGIGTELIKKFRGFSLLTSGQCRKRSQKIR